MYTQDSSTVQSMFGTIAKRYDVANDVLSLGIHGWWKRNFINRIPLPYGIAALDLACGTGDLVPILAEKFGDNIVGGDFCLPMLDVARKRFGDRFTFMQSDALNLQFPDNHFDLVTISFGVRNFEDLRRGLKEVFRVLKPGGMIAVLEFGQPEGKIFSSLYRWYSKFLMPKIGGILTGNQQAYSYLPETAAQFPCGKKFSDELSLCGFKDPTFRPYTFGIAFGYWASKPTH